MADHVKRISKRSSYRFPVDENSWPPEQPKDFTPVVLIHYRDNHDTTKSPHIIYPAGERFCNLYAMGNREASYVHETELENSAVTKDIRKILDPLTKNDGPQIILIEGAPGIGKSVLLREIAYRWANLQVLHKFKLLLLVSLRDPVIQKMSTLEELCHYFCNYGMKDTEIISMCVKYFFKNGGKNLIFLLDGYDEYPENLRQKKGNLIANILWHHELPECGIVVSSRPHGLVHLRGLANTRVEILGFTEKEQEQFILREFKNQHHKILDIIEYLKKNLIISSMCIVPFNMMILLYLYKIKSVLPKNSTELYKIFICHAINQNLVKHEITFNPKITDFSKFPDPYGKFIKQLSEWSLRALQNNQLTFTLDEIKTLCPEIETIPGAINGLGLMRTVEHSAVFEASKTFNFIHFSIQEFLAAHYISCYLSHRELLSLFEDKFWDNFYSNMFMLYVALTKGQQVAFKDFLCDKYQKRPSFKDDLYDNKQNIIIAEDFLTNQIKSLHLFRCFSEANDIEMCAAIEKAFSTKQILLGGKVLLPNDVQSVAVLLTQSSIKHWDKLDLFLSHIQHHGIRILHHALKDSNVTIREIIFTKNGLSSSSDSLVRDIVINCRVKVLWISYNDCVGETKQFSAMLSNPACKLRTLYVRYNKLSRKAAISIFTELRIATCSKLKLLEISYNYIDDFACGVIAITLKSNKSLKRLEMYKNNITIKGVEKLLEALQNNTTLTFLGLPKYSDTDTIKIKLLQESINNKRKKCSCLEELKIIFSA